MRKFCEIFCDTRGLFGISVLVIVTGVDRRSKAVMPECVPVSGTNITRR